MVIVRIIETQRVQNMASDWYKITGRDKNGKEYLVDESKLSYSIRTGEYVQGEVHDGKCYAEKFVDGFDS